MMSDITQSIKRRIFDQPYRRNITIDNKNRTVTQVQREIQKGKMRGI